MSKDNTDDKAPFSDVMYEQGITEGAAKAIESTKIAAAEIARDMGRPDIAKAILAIDPIADIDV